MNRGLPAYFLLTLIAVSFFLTFNIFRPFLAPLALAAAFAVVLQPLYHEIFRHIRNSSWTSTFTLLITAVCIIIPLVLIGTLVGREATKLYGTLVDGSGVEIIRTTLSRMQEWLAGYYPGIADFSDVATVNVTAYAQQGLSWLSSHVATAFSGIATLFLNLFVFLVALFFFLRDGESFKKTIINLSPLADSDDETVFNRLGVAVNSVIRGNLLIALIRGILASIGFFLFGVPNAILWGTVTGLVGLIPGIGLFVMFTPTILYLFFMVGTVPALGLLAWAVFVVGMADNILGPKLVGQGTQLHPLFVLLAILGGIGFFGPIGIFLGPLALSLLYALLSIYSTRTKHAQ